MTRTREILLAAIFVAALFPGCRSKEISFKEYLASLPRRDTGQALNPANGSEIKGYKMRIGQDSRDSWTLAGEDYLVAEADCGSQLNLSLAIIGGKRSLSKLQGAVATVDLDVRDKQQTYTKPMVKESISQLGGSWKDFKVPLGGNPGNQCSLRLTYSLNPPAKAGDVFLAVANSRIVASEPAGKKNIVILSVDTMGANHVSLYGYGRKTTPSIDAFASQALVFDNALSASSFTVTSVASLFTSLYPSEHGALGKDQMVLPEENLTLAEVLERQGYRTAAFSASPFVSAEFQFGQGFGNFYSETNTHADVLNQKVIPWLTNHSQEQPFFLYVMYFDPHQPYAPPGSYDRLFQKDANGRELWPDKMLENKPVRLQKLPSHISEVELEFVRSQYDGEVAYADHYLGLVLKELDGLGLLSNTIVIITADHGEELHEHGAFGHSRTLYQEMLHVPLVLYYPGLAEPGRRIPELVRTVDVMPTLLELAGIGLPDKIEGVSLMPLINGSGEFRPRPAFAELKPFLNPKNYLRSLQDANFKVIENLPSGKIEFYNLVDDPSEKNDLAGRPDPHKDALIAQMRIIQKSAQKLTHSSRSVPGQDQMLKSLGYTK